MRKEENTEKDDLYSKLQVHFIENVETEKVSEERKTDSEQLSAEAKEKSASHSKNDRAINKNKKNAGKLESGSEVQKVADDSAETDSEDNTKEQKGRRKRRHTKAERQEEAVEDSFYKVTGEAEEHKSHPIRNTIL